MKNISISILTMIACCVAVAKTNPAVQKAANSMKSNDVRTITREVENTDGNPCMPEGKSYQVDLQIKKVAGYNPEKNKVVYSWETVKSIGVDKDGRVMEVCAE